MEQGDSENTSWKGADGEITSEPIGCATEFTQVHSRTDPMGRTDSSVSRRGKRSTQSEDARNAEAKHISVHLDCSDCEKPNKKEKEPVGITPEIRRPRPVFLKSEHLCLSLPFLLFSLNVFVSSLSCLVFVFVKIQIKS